MSGLAGATIHLIDYTRRTLKQRKADRQYAGNYRFTVGPVISGRQKDRQAGFYFASGLNLAIDAHGASFRLRVSEANNHLRDTGCERSARINGYWGDPENQYSLIIPYVLALPHGRGWLAAWGGGLGMWGAYDPNYIHDTPDEAARDAHACAALAALREQEYLQQEREKFEQERACEENEA